jgi:hypothetical protein
MRKFYSIVVGALAFLAFPDAALAKQEEPVACSVTAPNVTCVMNQLDDPRALAFGPQGSLFVVEAGTGAAPCKAPIMGFNCYGHTGAVSRLWRGEQVRVASGMPSLSFPLGASARGPHGILMWSGPGTQPSSLGGEGALVSIGLEMTSTARNAAGRGDMGRLLHIPMDTLMAPSSQLCPGCWTSVLDVAGGFNPTQESDPYNMLLEKGPGADDDTVLLIDSSRNALLRIDTQGAISSMATFPSRPARVTDSVPTTIARGPDGEYYVGEFIGIPFQTNANGTRQPANIYRVSADPPHDVSVVLGGFNAIIAIAFQGEDLYVLQHWSSFASSTLKDGKLIRIACHDRPLVCDGAREVVIDHLDVPTALLIGRGAIYISHHGATPEFTSQTSAPQHLGEVLRIPLDDDGDDGEED